MGSLGTQGEGEQPPRGGGRTHARGKGTCDIDPTGRTVYEWTPNDEAFRASPRGPCPAAA